MWIKKKGDFKEKNVRTSVKHGGDSMVWDCIASCGSGKLQIIDRHAGRFKYLAVLKDNLKKSSKTLDIEQPFQFYHDDNPKPKSRFFEI